MRSTSGSISAARRCVAVNRKNASARVLFIGPETQKGRLYAVLSVAGGWCAYGLDGGDVRRLETLRSLDHVELDRSAFRQRAEAVRLDGGEVHEHVFAGLGRDEAKTLRIVEPLDFTSAAHTSDSPSSGRPCIFHSCPDLSCAERNFRFVQ